MSDNIPRGVWLNQVMLNEDVLLLGGSAVSQFKDEMGSVGNFAQVLQEDQKFMQYLTNIELSSIQRRKVYTVEVADFLITANLKERKP
jgi:hypothetical protein